MNIVDPAPGKPQDDGRLFWARLTQFLLKKQVVSAQIPAFLGWARLLCQAYSDQPSFSLTSAEFRAFIDELPEQNPNPEQTDEARQALRLFYSFLFAGAAARGKQRPPLGGGASGPSDPDADTNASASLRPANRGVLRRLGAALSLVSPGPISTRTQISPGHRLCWYPDVHSASGCGARRIRRHAAAGPECAGVPLPRSTGNARGAPGRSFSLPQAQTHSHRADRRRGASGAGRDRGKRRA